MSKYKQITPENFLMSDPPPGIFATIASGRVRPMLPDDLIEHVHTPALQLTKQVPEDVAWLV
jgi:hypothetical protein